MAEQHPYPSQPPRRPEEGREGMQPPQRPQSSPSPSFGPTRPAPQRPSSPRPAENAQQEPQRKDQKLEYLKHEDVRTMEKDITRRRERESLQERDRITKEQFPEKKTGHQEIEDRIHRPGPERSGPEGVRAKSAPPTPPSEGMPKAPSRFQRKFIRVVIALLVLFFLATAGLVLYWLFFWQDGDRIMDGEPTPTVTPVPTPTPDPTPTVTPTATPVPTPTVLQPIFPIERSLTLLLEERGELSSLLERAMHETQTAGFYHVVVKDKATNQPLGASTLLDYLNLALPPSFIGHIGERYTFFAHFHPAEQRKRFGFVFETQNPQQAMEILAQEEARLEQHLQILTSLAGGRGSGYTQQFRSYEYGGTTIRFQTLSTTDVGVCYARVGNHILIATSLGSIEQAIDQLRQ